MGFTRKTFSSPEFKSIFEQNFGSLAKKKIIETGEILLSQTLLKAGFRGKAYVGYDNFIEKAKGEFHNPAYYFWAEMIRDFKFPFLKKDLINNNPEFFDNILDVFEVIETRTSYPVDNIIEVVADSRDKEEEKKDAGLKPLVICHMFFYDIALKFMDQLTILNQYNAIFVFNISAALHANKSFVRILRKVFPGCIVINSPNQGRDIGGKFAALNIALKLGIRSDITLIIHDKKSVHIGEGALWRDELFKIIGNKLLPTIFENFRNKKEIGIICSARFIQNEYNEKKGGFLSTSDQNIKTLLKKYQVPATNYDYLAGNIFWIRTNLLEEFFRERSLFEIRAELEKGNALDFGKGTFIHSWERIMSWIATSQGYTLYGI
jgi:lipopolysaccharide biosynthesis protein